MLNTPDLIIHIIGTQPMPNLLATLHWGTDNILLATDKTKHIASSIKTIAESHNLKAEIISIPKNDFRTLNESLKTLLNSYQNKKVWLHLTGGTKLMVMAGYHFAQNFKLPVIYLDFDRTTFITILPDGNIIENTLDVKVHIDDYLFVHGYSIKLRKSSVLPQLEHFSKLIGENHQKILPRPSDRVPLKGRKNRKKKLHDLYSDHEKHPEGTNNCLRKRLFSNLKNFYKADYKKIKKFLNGEWLEIFTFSKIKKLFDESYYQVQLHQKLRSVSNEIDVIGIRNNRFYIISCKTGIITKEHLAELDVLRRLIGGVQSRAALVTSNSFLPSPIRELLLRADIYNIKIFTVENFKTLEMDFSEWLNEQ